MYELDGEGHPPGGDIREKRGKEKKGYKLENR
jgi:hypothetical protein